MIRFVFQKVSPDGSEKDRQQRGKKKAEKPRQGLEIFNLPENSIPKCNAFMEIKSS